MVQIKIEYFKLINHVKIFRFVCWGTNASADLQKSAFDSSWTHLTSPISCCDFLVYSDV